MWRNKRYKNVLYITKWLKLKWTLIKLKWTFLYRRKCPRGDWIQLFQKSSTSSLFPIYIFLNNLITSLICLWSTLRSHYTQDKIIVSTADIWPQTPLIEMTEWTFGASKPFPERYLPVTSTTFVRCNNII